MIFVINCKHKSMLRGETVKDEKWLTNISVELERDRELIKRSYYTLMNNVYPDNGFLWSPYRCISPGKTTFHGIWNWDSAFHAVGVARWSVELAKESIEGFLKFQREDGLIPDVIYEDGSVVSSFGKPPLFAWATEIIYKQDYDVDFVKGVYPKLKKNAEYLEKYRCYEGLFYYDADDKETDDYLTRVKYESGWDNSVRWDNGINEYWAVDLNCFMVMFYSSLSYLAQELNLSEDMCEWQNKEKYLCELINKNLWNDNGKYYADVNRFTKEASEVLSPASFMPLYICIATEKMAQSMNEIAKENFKGKMPTVSFDNPEYSNDYWRGPTWLNVAYFAAKGLKNYGCQVADEIKESILNMCFEEKTGIYENYDSISGKGLCCNSFSWSAVFIIEFILNWESTKPVESYK